ncbi:MAG: PfkB family carbohydrate kinase, partial [Candidatus Omnitrophica bacterium]|nr:PfkB family carbohydrate kinase [Candidatus Omnitrophota bacterium]
RELARWFNPEIGLPPPDDHAPLVVREAYARRHAVRRPETQRTSEPVVWAIGNLSCDIDVVKKFGTWWVPSATVTQPLFADDDDDLVTSQTTTHGFVSAGGGNINIARALVGTGSRVVPLFFYGGDIGKFLLEKLAEEGVDISGAVELEEGKTTQVMIVTAMDKSESLLAKRTPVSEAEWQRLVERLMDPEKGVNPGDIITISSVPPTGLPSDVQAKLSKKLTEERQARVIVDPAGDSALQIFRQGMAEIFSVNQAEFVKLVRQLDGTALDASDLNAFVRKAQELIRRRANAFKQIVITLGAQGAVSVTEEQALYVPSPAVSKVVTEIGAGDIFRAMLARELREGRDQRQMLVRAVAAASSSVEIEGSGGLDLPRAEALAGEVDQKVRVFSVPARSETRPLKLPENIGQGTREQIGVIRDSTLDLYEKLSQMVEHGAADLAIRRDEALRSFLRLSGGAGLLGEHVDEWLVANWQPYQTSSDLLALLKNWAPRDFVKIIPFIAQARGVSGDELWDRILTVIRFIQWGTIAYFVEQEGRIYRGLPVTIVEQYGDIRNAGLILGTGLNKSKELAPVSSPINATLLLDPSDVSYARRVQIEDMAVELFRTRRYSASTVEAVQYWKANVFNTSMIVQILREKKEAGERLVELVIEEAVHFMHTSQELAELINQRGRVEANGAGSLVAGVLAEMAIHVPQTVQTIKSWFLPQVSVEDLFESWIQRSETRVENLVSSFKFPVSSFKNSKLETQNLKLVPVRSEVRPVMTLEQVADARSVELFRFGRELLGLFSDYNAAKANQRTEDIQAVSERIRHFAVNLDSYIDEIRGDDETENAGLLVAAPRAPPEAGDVPRWKAALTKKNSELENEVRGYDPQFVQAHNDRDHQTLDRLNHEVVPLIKQRLRVQLLRLQQTLAQPVINQGAALMILNFSVIKLYHRLAYEYGWRERRARGDEKISRFRMADAGGHLVFNIYYEREPVLRVERHPDGQLTISQIVWKEVDVPGGQPALKPVMTPMNFEELDTALRSRIKAMASQEEDYTQLVYHDLALDDVMSALSPYEPKAGETAAEPLPVVLREQVLQSLEAALEGPQGRRGLRRKRARVDDPRKPGEKLPMPGPDLESAVQLIGNGDIKTAVQLIASARRYIAGRLNDVERTQAATIRKRNYVYLIIRDDQIAQSLRELRDVLTARPFDISQLTARMEDLEGVRGAYLSHIVSGQEDTGYHGLRRSVQGVLAAARTLQTDLARTAPDKIRDGQVRNLGGLITKIGQVLTELERLRRERLEYLQRSETRPSSPGEAAGVRQSRDVNVLIERRTLSRLRRVLALPLDKKAGRWEGMSIYDAGNRPLIHDIELGDRLVRNLIWANDTERAPYVTIRDLPKAGVYTQECFSCAAAAFRARLSYGNVIRLAHLPLGAYTAQAATQAETKQRVDQRKLELVHQSLEHILERVSGPSYLFLDVRENMIESGSRWLENLEQTLKGSNIRILVLVRPDDTVSATYVDQDGVAVFITHAISDLRTGGVRKAIYRSEFQARALSWDRIEGLFRGRSNHLLIYRFDEDLGTHVNATDWEATFHETSILGGKKSVNLEDRGDLADWDDNHLWAVCRHGGRLFAVYALTGLAAAYGVRVSEFFNNYASARFADSEQRARELLARILTRIGQIRGQGFEKVGEMIAEKLFARSETRPQAASVLGTTAGQVTRSESRPGNVPDGFQRRIKEFYQSGHVTRLREAYFRRAQSRQLAVLPVRFDRIAQEVLEDAVGLHRVARDYAADFENQVTSVVPEISLVGEGEDDRLITARCVHLADVIAFSFYFYLEEAILEFQARGLDGEEIIQAARQLWEGDQMSADLITGFVDEQFRNDPIYHAVATYFYEHVVEREMKKLSSMSEFGLSDFHERVYAATRFYEALAGIFSQDVAQYPLEFEDALRKTEDLLVPPTIRSEARDM